MDRRVAGLAVAAAVGSLAVILYLTLVSNQAVFWFSVVLLGLLVIICESLGEEMAQGGRSTYGIIAIFGAIVALNTPSAMIVALAGALHLRLAQRKEEPWKLAFNGALYALCTWAASATYHGLGGVSRSFVTSDILRSLAPLIAAAAVFWALNSLAVGAALRWLNGTEPKEFLEKVALKLLPNQLIYGLVGLGLGVIYAQNAFYVDAGHQVVGSLAGSLRGLFAVLCLVALLGVAWYFSGKNIELLESYDHSVEVLMTHLERREPYLDGHAVRVAAYATAIARHYRLPFYEVNRIRHAALLHDLGRPAIPREILLQPGQLSEEEFDKVKIHPLEGASRLEEVEYLAEMAEAVRHHHEYYDGGGYIDHLSGDTIPLSARIIAVADAYDSMLNRRPWREAKGHERAVAELRQNSGRQFDPEIVEHFIAALEEAVAVERAPREEAAREKGPRAEAIGREVPREEAAGEAAPTARRTAAASRLGKRRAKKREELLQARREARERLEREAMRILEEEGPPSGEDGSYPHEAGGEGEMPGEGPAPEGGGAAK
jgi:putative nucleotidyltransferase with HDIG domain